MEDYERIENIPSKAFWLCECGYWVQSGNLVDPCKDEGERISHDPIADHFEIKQRQ